MQEARSGKRSSPWAAAAFALTPLAVSFIPPWVVFRLDPNAASTIGLEAVSIPAWVFTAVWIVAYPGMGLAAWRVWRLRDQIDAAVPLVTLAASYLVTLSFWMTHSLRMTATLDLINLVLAWTMLWVFARYSKAAAIYLLPWAVWMPITLALKLHALGWRPN